jgi:hypothetical protein
MNDLFFRAVLVSPDLPPSQEVFDAINAQPSDIFDDINAIPSDVIGTISRDYSYGGESAGVTWTWNTVVGYIVHGTHYCATNAGSGLYLSPVKGQSPSGSNGWYCYCKLLDIDGISCYASWVYLGTTMGPSHCYNDCSFSCALYVQIYSVFRAAVVSTDVPSSYKTFDASSCPADYMAIPSNVGTITENDVACENGTCNISCTWQ